MAVRRDREAEAGLLVDADHAAVVGEAQRGVAHHVVVVLVGDPRLVGEVGAAEQLQDLGAQRVGVIGAGQRGAESRLQRVDPGRVGDRPLVHRPVDRDRARVDVDDLLAVPV